MLLTELLLRWLMLRWLMLRCGGCCKCRWRGVGCGRGELLLRWLLMSCRAAVAARRSLPDRRRSVHRRSCGRLLLLRRLLAGVERVALLLHRLGKAPWSPLLALTLSLLLLLVLSPVRLRHAVLRDAATRIQLDAHVLRAKIAMRHVWACAGRGERGMLRSRTGRATAGANTRKGLPGSRIRDIARARRWRRHKRPARSMRGNGAGSTSRPVIALARESLVILA